MTRFQIVAIFNDEMFTAGEFNGDGYFEGGFGEDVCRAFATMRTKNQYREFAYKMNNEHFEYPEDVVYKLDSEDIDDKGIYRIFNFRQMKKENSYYKIWFSDYLYIINLSDEDQEIISEKGTKITLHPYGWVTINFGELYKQDDPNAEIKCMDNVTIDETGWITNKIEELGWTVDKNDEDKLWDICKYTPNGEDFFFTIDTTDDIIEEIEKYYNDFDVDDHVIMWIQSEAQGIPSIRDLLEDAEWIDAELKKLVNELKK